jgi:hypothetical protein
MCDECGGDTQRDIEDVFVPNENKYYIHVTFLRLSVCIVRAAV